MDKSQIMETQEKEVNATIVSKRETLETRNIMRADMVKQLTAKIEAKEKEIENKKYIIEGGTKTATAVVNFLQNEASWKFSEALGVIEATRQVEEAQKEILKGKTKELLIPALAVEAIYYFLTKVEGKGLIHATSYVNELLKPVTDALSRSKNDRTEIDQLVRDRGTIESAIDNGIDIENEDEILKEIQEELEK
jgi:hypothetical protein